MTERVPSDHPSVTTHRASLERSGGTRRPCLRLPDATELESGDLVRLVLDGDEFHAAVTGDSSGLVVRSAHDNRRMAREREGANRLVEWADDVGRGPGDAVEVDEVVPGTLYGVRVPGVRAVYSATETPRDSLSSIAESLDGRDDARRD
ncbi:hypothetical protein C2R22_00465 [Salinigranum rubrum]|uniref:Uncharacterized protein n=1 Tax=Salinigranum rubrum TaxID=755307 RepID=A0A2I8VEG4_9EURY|nr:hypothetical protein [Salinigranum rubrum]AUV80317.1 hypothetical protein C2R22_00465 [Salinigranum rubrum]